MGIKAAITAVGGYLPETRLTNQDLEKMVDTNDQWIQERTGIVERRILKDGRATSDMAAEAVNNLLEKRGITADEIDLLIVATVTADHIFPATANLVAAKCGATKAWSFDLNAACSGFLFALTTGTQFIETGKHKKVVVVGADKMSSIIDYEDRNTCIIFGDGAGAVLLEPSESENGIMDSILYSDGNGFKHLHQKAGGSKFPPTIESVQNREHYVYQEGRSVFKYAVTGMADVSAEIMAKNNLTGEDVNWLVPHQANKRIIDATRRRMELSEEKVMLNIQRFGNTTAATIPLCYGNGKTNSMQAIRLSFLHLGVDSPGEPFYVKWAYDHSN